MFTFLLFLLMQSYVLVLDFCFEFNFDDSFGDLGQLQLQMPPLPQLQEKPVLMLP